MVKFENCSHLFGFAKMLSFNYIYGKNDPNLCQIV